MKNEGWFIKPVIVTVVGGLIVGFALFFIERNTEDRSGEGKEHNAGLRSPIIERVHTENGLGWANFHIGMTVEEVEFYTGSLSLQPDELDDELCGAEILYIGVEVYFTFKADDNYACLNKGSNRSNLILLQIMMEFTFVESRMSKGELIRELRKRIPNLKYAPGRHEPEMVEEYDDSPLFTLGETGGLGILLQLDEETVFLAYTGMFD